MRKRKRYWTHNTTHFHDAPDVYAVWFTDKQPNEQFWHESTPEEIDKWNQYWKLDYAN